MKLSAKSRYAARILLELARVGDSRPVSATMLSQLTGVSVQFVEQILKPLKQRGFTASQRGAAGGHFLALPAQEITLGKIVDLMEGGIYLSVCCGKGTAHCARAADCRTREAWVSVSNTLQKELDKISLLTLLHGENVCPESCDLTIIAAKAKPASQKTKQTTKAKPKAKPKAKVKKAQ